MALIVLPAGELLYLLLKSKLSNSKQFLRSFSDLACNTQLANQVAPHWSVGVSETA